MHFMKGTTFNKQLMVLICLFFVLGATCVLSQTTWSRTYVFNNFYGNEGATSHILTTPDGGYIALRGIDFWDTW
jgi:hypothetical protein